MIALVITIIVIIILAAIVMVSSTNTIGSANYAKFAHELSEIQDKVTVKRNENQVDGPGEAIHNQGFKKVHIENAPSNFVSFDEDQMTGYWVIFDTIQEKDIKTGREELTTDEVRFGKNDVYVYDAEGKVYYAKGWLDENEELHYRIDTKAEDTENPDVALPNLTASYTLSADKTSATVTIVAGAVNGGTLTVTVDGASPTQIGQNTYEYVVTENGKLTIVASESGGGSRTKTLTIEGIRVPDVTPPEITSLTGDASATSVVIRGTAQDTESNIVGYKFTDGNSEPTDWITVNASSISPSYTATVDGTYYFWVKNEDGLVSSQSITVALKKKYTITYNANGGNLGEVPSTQEKIEDENATLSTKSPTREGYNFKGWGTSSTAISPSYQAGATYVVDANIELYAVWEAKTYTVKYNANGGSLGSVPSSELKTYNKTYTINSNSPSRDGYIFKGWGTSSSSTTATYQPNGTYTTDANLELYAIWEINTYTITYNANGGSLGNVPSTQTKTYNQNLTLDSNSPSRDGYVFQGWATSSNSITVAYQPNGTYTGNADIELYAAWKANTYTVKYNANGGSLGSVSSTQTKIHDQSLTINSNNPSRDGYTFQGWGTASNSTTAAYQPNGTYTGNADIELFAIWKANTYTVTYNANGGSLGSVPSTQTKTHGQNLTLDGNSPTREGYIFLGWGISSNSTTASYQPNETYVGDENLNLYAVWKEEDINVQLLADKAQIGDYVNYGIEYSNVYSSGKTSSLKGWRVLSKGEDGTVNLVSAGVPLLYCHPNGGDGGIASANKLTNNLLNISIYDSTVDTNNLSKYTSVGFTKGKSLTEIFVQNEYTLLKNGIPIIRAMNNDDILEIIGLTSVSSGTSMDLANEKYNELFKIGTYYWTASADESKTVALWSVNHDGSMGSYYNYIMERGVRPVVSLKPEVYVTGQDANGAWNIDIDMVTFDADIGSGVMAQMPIIKGEKCVLPESEFITPDGYKFIGWTINGSVYEVGDEIVLKNDTVLKATWQTMEIAIEGLEESYTYTGNEILPQIEIYESNEKLVEGQDYTILYGENTYVGKGNITISFLGIYGGNITQEFAIKALDGANHASFTFGENTFIEKIIEECNYIMPNVDSIIENQIGSVTINGEIIYYPIATMVMSDGSTSHMKEYSGLYPIFDGVVSIIDYGDYGRGEKITYDTSTTVLPNNLYPLCDTLGANGPEEIFKYGATTEASATPIVSNEKLYYSSPGMLVGNEEYNTVVKWRYIDNAGKVYYYYIGYYAEAQTYNCITPDTLLTLADGSQKRMDEVTYEDELLVWNFEKGEYAVTKPAVLYNHGEANNRVIKLTFDDGTILKLIGTHDLFDADANEFVAMNEYNVSEYIGHEFIKAIAEDGYSSTKLVKYDIVEEHIGSYSILTAKHLNCITEGILSRSPSPDAEKEDFFDFFEIGEGMKYDEEAMQRDIEKYGLYTYEDYEGYVTYEQFVALNGAYFKVLVEKGYITFEDVIKAINLYVPN